MDQRVIKELIEVYGFTQQEIEEHKDQVKNMLLTKEINLKYAVIDAWNELVKKS